VSRRYRVSVRTGWRTFAALVLGVTAATVGAPPAMANPSSGCLPRSVTVDDVERLEGGPSSGNVLSFIVAAPGCGSGSVRYQTVVRGSPAATAGVDYIVASGTLSWTSTGPDAHRVDVALIGDDEVEQDEELALQLTSASGVLLLDTQAVGTIVNDDLAVEIETPTSEPHCDRIDRTCHVWIVATPKAHTAVTIHYATGDGTALAGREYVGVPVGAATIPAGATGVRVAIALWADAGAGPAGYFYVRIVAASTGAVVTPTATVTIPSG
jgi:hypothetical protein